MFATLWSISLERNRRIFEDTSEHSFIIFDKAKVLGATWVLANKIGNGYTLADWVRSWAYMM